MSPEDCHPKIEDRSQKTEFRTPNSKLRASNGEQ
jgi:hypothetical protein